MGTRAVARVLGLAGRASPARGEEAHEKRDRCGASEAVTQGDALMQRPMEQLEHSIEVEAPVTATYNQWTQFEDFPRFMEGVESVTQIDDKRVHWVAVVAGKRKEWDAEITRQVPDREIDWVGLGDADNRGRIVFEEIDADTSKVTMMLDYDPEGMVEE